MQKHTYKLDGWAVQGGLCGHLVKIELETVLAVNTLVLRCSAGTSTNGKG